MSNWFHPMPVYVTRPNADGVIAQFTIGAVFAVLATLLVTFNIIGWGIYGLVELGMKVV